MRWVLRTPESCQTLPVFCLAADLFSNKMAYDCLAQEAGEGRLLWLKLGVRGGPTRQPCSTKAQGPSLTAPMLGRPGARGGAAKHHRPHMYPLPRGKSTAWPWMDFLSGPYLPRQMRSPAGLHHQSAPAQLAELWPPAFCSGVSPMARGVHGPPAARDLLEAGHCPGHRLCDLLGSSSTPPCWWVQPHLTLGGLNETQCKITTVPHETYSITQSVLKTSICPW